MSMQAGTDFSLALPFLHGHRVAAHAAGLFFVGFLLASCLSQFTLPFRFLLLLC